MSTPTHERQGREQLALAAHRMLSDLAVINGKAEFLRRHRGEVTDEVCERWLSDIEQISHNLGDYLGLVARGLVPDCSWPAVGDPTLD